MVLNVPMRLRQRSAGACWYVQIAGRSVVWSVVARFPQLDRPSSRRDGEKMTGRQVDLHDDGAVVAACWRRSALIQPGL